MKHLLLLLTLALAASGQSWQNHPNSAVTFVDLTNRGQQSPPTSPNDQSYFNLYIPFPQNADGTSAVAQASVLPCKLEDLQYKTYGLFTKSGYSNLPEGSAQFRWVSADTYNSVYTMGQPAQWFSTSNKSYMRGVEYDGALGGTLTGNTGVRSAFVLSVFVNERSCFDGGPEFGFYRILKTPGGAIDETPNVVYFYYSTVTNCTGAPDPSTPLSSSVFYSTANQQISQTNCQNRETGQFASANISGQFEPGLSTTDGTKIVWPVGTAYQANSCGPITRYDWKYRAIATADDEFTITVLDPCSQAVMKTQRVRVQPWFRPYTKKMIDGGIWAYTTVVAQKALFYNEASTPNLNPGPNEGDLLCATSGGPVGSCVDKPAIGIVSIGSAQSDGAIGRVPDLEPRTSSGLSKTLTASYYSSASITAAQFLVNSQINGASACYVTYVPAVTGASSLNLVSDTGTAFSTITVGSGTTGTVSNSQCTLNAAGSSIRSVGRHLIVKLSLTFNGAGFGGHKHVFGAVQDSDGRTSEWQNIGAVTVPVSSPPMLQAEQVTHSETYNLARPYAPGSPCGSDTRCLPPIALRPTFSFSGTGGGSAITNARVLINTALDGSNACHFTFYTASGSQLAFLYNDDGTTLQPTLNLATLAAGASTSMSNSQCRVIFSRPPSQPTTGAYAFPTADPIVVSGNSMSIRVNVEPLGRFVSSVSPNGFSSNSLRIFTAAEIISPTNVVLYSTGWQATGAWTLP